MCAYSMVGDHYTEVFPAKYPSQPWIPYAPNVPSAIGAQVSTPISRQEFEALKAMVEDMKKLLERAKQYDKDNGEPECETEDKIALLKQVAKYVGVDLDDLRDGDNGC